MKRKNPKDPVIEAMNKINAQLAVMDNKLDQFMTKSLKELAEAMAVVKSVRPASPLPARAVTRDFQRPARSMFAVICYACGKDTEIPFKPAAGRPVYCKECFAKRRNINARANIPGSQTVNLSSARVIPAANAPAKGKDASVAKSKNKRKPAARKKVVKKKTAIKKTATKKAARKK